MKPITNYHNLVDSRITINKRQTLTQKTQF